MEKKMYTISNDTYHYLLSGAEPLDEDNFQEIQCIDDNPEWQNKKPYIVGFLPDGRLHVMLDSHTFTHTFSITSKIKCDFCYLDSGKVFYRMQAVDTGLSWGYAEASIEMNDAGKPQFKTEKNSIFPLWTKNIKAL